MKVVIDITEEHYEFIKNLPYYKRNYAEDLILEGVIIDESEERKEEE